MRHKSVSYAKYGYIFSIPFVLVFLIFYLYPVFYTITIGFTDLKGIGKTDFNILPDILGNFKLIIDNPSFIKSLGNTLIIWIINFIPQIGLALLLAAWFTSRRFKTRGQGAFKVLFYMPNIITAATIAILFNVLFGYPKGPVNDLLVSFGIIESPFYYLQDVTSSRLIIAFIQFWMWYGNTMLILIGGVMGISPALFEAAEIDGATATQTFFRITLPSLRTIILYVLVTSLIGGLAMFDIPFLFNLGRPDNSTLTVSMFIYNQAFAGSYLFNRAAAASMILFVIIAILSAGLFYILRNKDEVKQYREKKALMKEAKAKARAQRKAAAEGGVA
ncbi:MAG: sugar ABC transporter permease [Spirochaetales bacterium]|nr:sugar ABC transporter permease [Spirochaetales bacterium]